MKYIITESKLSNYIYEYIDSYLNSNEINWEYGPDEDNEDEDNEEFLIFYKEENGGEEEVFNYFKPDYYEDPGGYKDKAPILEVLDEYGERLDNMFDIYWHEPMKKWFEDKFNLPVKSVESHYSDEI